MITIYLVALAFGLTLLVASTFMGGKDTDHGDGGHAGDVGLGWAPVASLRFWVFLFAVGGGVGLALEKLGSGTLVSAIGAGIVGWIAGASAVLIIRTLNKNSVSSESHSGEVVGMTGTLMLPVKANEPGKVRVEYKGRAEDFIAHVDPDDKDELKTGITVLIIAKGKDDSVIVSDDLKASA